MYLFDNFKDIYTPGKLKEFLADLYSGKLHREYHYGPEKSTQKTGQNEIEGGGKATGGKGTHPPESTFKNLAPSKNRYTLLRDEL